MSGQAMGYPTSELRICGHGYHHPHCPIMGCPHHGNVSGQQLLPELGVIRTAISPLGGIIPAAPTQARGCEHCYCMTPTVPWGQGPHRQCCNCGNRQREENVYAPLARGERPVHGDRPGDAGGDTGAGDR